MRMLLAQAAQGVDGVARAPAPQLDIADLRERKLPHRKPRQANPRLRVRRERGERLVRRNGIGHDKHPIQL